MSKLSPVQMVRSAKLVMSGTCADSLAMADLRYKSAAFRAGQTHSNFRGPHIPSFPIYRHSRERTSPRT